MTISFTYSTSTAGSPATTDYTWSYGTDVISVKGVNRYAHWVPLAGHDTDLYTFRKAFTDKYWAGGLGTLAGTITSGTLYTSAPTWVPSGSDGYWNGGSQEVVRILWERSSVYNAYAFYSDCDRLGNKVIYPLDPDETIPSWAFTQTPTHVGGYLGRPYCIREPISDEVLFTCYPKKINNGPGAFEYGGFGPLDDRYTQNSTGSLIRRRSNGMLYFGTSSLPLIGRETIDYSGNYYFYGNGSTTGTLVVDFVWYNSNGVAINSTSSSAVAITVSGTSGRSVVVPYDFNSVARPDGGRYAVVVPALPGDYTSYMSAFTGFGARGIVDPMPFGSSNGSPDAVAAPGILVPY